MAAAVVAEGLGKKYLIGHVTESYPTIRDAIARRVSRIGRQVGQFASGRMLMSADETEEFWALKDVSFSIGEGEVVGVIGKNGAGKSTLLKILSRVVEPSSGYAEIRGRVASLLEVGTGFHPELTGRENIFLNGALMGMSRSDIRKRFDEIVAFSEVEKFLDTPVKRYSSGMYVRLAFAVAAHLEPEILVVDEVLSVGDAQFQQKCLGKVREVSSREGRTVLFVSHQMSMVTSLCSRAILLNDGSIRFEGSATEAVAKYYSLDGMKPYVADYTKTDRVIGDDYAVLLSAVIENEKGEPAGEVDIRQGFKIKMRYRLTDKVSTAPTPGIHVYNSMGQLVFASGAPFKCAPQEGVFESICCVPGNLMNGDVYVIDLVMQFFQQRMHVSFHDRSALSVVVVDPVEETQFGDVRNGYAGPWGGAVRPYLQWETSVVAP